MNSEPVNALSIIVHRSQAERPTALCERLKDLIPRQLAVAPAAGRRTTVQGFAQDVSPMAATHKRKLLEKQKEKRMRQFGKVEIPQSALIAALKMGDG